MTITSITTITTIDIMIAITIAIIATTLIIVIIVIVFILSALSKAFWLKLIQRPMLWLAFVRAAFWVLAKNAAVYAMPMGIICVLGDPQAPQALQDEVEQDAEPEAAPHMAAALRPAPPEWHPPMLRRWRHEQEPGQAPPPAAPAHAPMSIWSILARSIPPARIQEARQPSPLP